jgi:hypothetical protein
MSRRDVLRHPGTWLLVVGGTLLYGWAPTTVPADAVGTDPVVPAWLVVAAPPLLYGLLLVGIPRVPMARRLAGVAALWLAHTLLGFATPLFYGVTGLLPAARADMHTVWVYPAAALLQLLAVPLIGFPFRGWLMRPRSRGRAASRAPRVTTRQPPATWEADALRTVGGERLGEDRPPREITPEWRLTLPPTRPPLGVPPRSPLPRTPTLPLTATAVEPSLPSPRAERRGLFEVPAAPVDVTPTPATSEPSPALIADPLAPILLDAAIAELLAEPMRPADVPAVPPPEADPIVTLAPTATPQPVAAVTEPPTVEPQAMEPPTVEWPGAELPSIETPSMAPLTTEPAPVGPAAATVELETWVAERPEAVVPPPPAVPTFEVAPTPAATLPAPPVMEPAAATEHAADLQRIAALLRPVAPLETGVHTLMGVTLLAACSPRLARAAVVQSAFRFLSFASGCARPMSQATLRGSNGAVVLTPLGPLQGGGPVLVTALAGRGALALLEVLSRRAAVEYWTTHPASPVEPAVETGETRGAHDLADVEVPARLQALGRSLGWTVATPRALKERTGRVLLYLLLPAGVDGTEVAELARDLYEALTADDDPGGVGPIQSLVLRLGSQRVIVKPVSEAPEGSTLLVAAAGDDRPGLVHRDVERIAARLSTAS